MGLFEHFPYTNFHSLNIQWAIEKIKELLQQGETLYGQLQQWKTDTDMELAAWKTQTLADLQTVTDALRDDLQALSESTTAEVNRIDADISAASDRLQRIETDLTEMQGLVPLTWEQGTINAQGEFDNTTIIRTAGYYAVSPGDMFLIKYNAEEYSYRIYTYAYDGTAYNIVTEIADSELLGAYRVAAGTTHIRIRFTHVPQQRTLPREGALNFFLYRANAHAFSLKDFGAKGDGVTDDTTAVQRAFSFGAVSIHVPTAAGQRYLVTDTLSVNPRTKTIYGDFSSHNVTEISGGIVFNATGSANSIKYLISTNVQCLRICNLSFDGTSRAQYTGLLTMPGSTADKDTSIEYCTIRNFYTVFNFRGRGLKFCNNLVATTSEVGTITFGPNDDPSATHPGKYGQRAILINNNRIHSIDGSTRAMIKVSQGHCNGMEITGNLVDLGYTPFFAGATSPASGLGDLWNVSISRNTLIGCEANAAWIQITHGARNCHFDDNTFFDALDYTDGQTAIASRAMWLAGTEGIVNCTVCNNAIDGTSNAAIYVANASGTTICGNSVTGAPAAIQLSGTLTACSVCNNTHLSETAGEGTMFSGDAQLDYCKVFDNTHNSGSGINSLTFTSQSRTDELPD